MDLSMPAGMPATPPALGTQEDGDDACVPCGWWTFRCTRQATRVTIAPAGVTGSIRSAGAR